MAPDWKKAESGLTTNGFDHFTNLLKCEVVPDFFLIRDPPTNKHGVKKTFHKLSPICLAGHLRLCVSLSRSNPMLQAVRGRGKSSPSLRVV
ncbi:hypothetical protein MTP99_015577 [Tenebrio molitor]|nr:hypothetical protein MTP99_015577 [Tenebrio molitor]